LLDAAERRSRSRTARLLDGLRFSRPSRRWNRTPLIAIAAAFLLVGVAFGAGLIKFGSPAKLPFSIYGNPKAGSGALVPGTVQMLPIAAPDPAGGPDWGMRMLSTTRGEGCLQVGRLLDGKLGVLGRDYAFHNDGRFHELAVSAGESINGCALLDGHRRLFTNVTADDRPASAWVGTGGRLGGCVPQTSGPYEKGLRLSQREKEMGARPAPICRQADLRNIYYGLLGPEAQSITYVFGGKRQTLDTVGPNGAYLFVTDASPHQLLNFANAGTADIVPVDGPIKEIHYRDGSTCHLTSKSWIGGADACTPTLSEPVGYLDVGSAPKPSEIATPIHTHLSRGRQGRYVIAVSFNARLAVSDARRIYSLRWREPSMPPKVYAGTATDTNIAAGETVTKTIGEYGPVLKPGVLHGVVSLQQAVGAGGIEGPGSVSVTVGNFAVRVP
jgi:hypothetical protein